MNLTEHYNAIQTQQENDRRTKRYAMAGRLARHEQQARVNNRKRRQRREAVHTLRLPRRMRSHISLTRENLRELHSVQKSAALA